MYLNANTVNISDDLFRLIATYDVFEYPLKICTMKWRKWLIATYDVFEYAMASAFNSFVGAINSNIRCIWIWHHYILKEPYQWLIATYDVFEYTRLMA